MGILKELDKEMAVLQLQASETNKRVNELEVRKESILNIAYQAFIAGTMPPKGDGDVPFRANDYIETLRNS